MTLRRYVPPRLKQALRPVLGRRPSDTVAGDPSTLAFLRQNGFLEGYGAPPAAVHALIRLKDEREGEPEREGSFTRAGLDMKDYELLFTLRTLRRHVPAGSRVLDVASGSSLLPAIYDALGFTAIHHDVHPLRYVDPALESVACDVLALADAVPKASVDAVTLICALEHFGLGRYGDRVDGRGDFHAMAQVAAVLKPGGILVVTVPYGPPAIVFNTHRIYDHHRLTEVLAGFDVLEEEYRAWPDWRAVGKTEAESIDLETAGKRPGKNYALALWAARKR